MASYKCPDVMCGLVMDADGDDSEICPRCGREMEEFFPELTECEVPSTPNEEHASPLARAISSKFRG